MSHVFHRAVEPITAVRAQGTRVWDDQGNSYLDAASGAIVTTVGHGDPRVVAALATAGELDYVHPTVFTTPVLERYAARVAGVVPVPDARVFPTSGGAESVETALKLARAYHLARGEDRDVVISRRRSYHGNTIGALRISGRETLRAPYEPWLSGPLQVPEVYEFRCPSPSHPDDCAGWHARELDTAITSLGPGRVAAFVGEAMGGATLAAAVPPDGYWEAIADVCATHGVLLIVDEVMSGFGRTGRWFAIEEWDVTPDIVVSGKGAGAGYWPLGLCICSGDVHATVVDGGGFIHGFTYSHSPIGAAVGLAVLERIVVDDLVGSAFLKGSQLQSRLSEAIGGLGVVGDIRGRGLLVGIELVADAGTLAPFPRREMVAERIASAARRLGLLVYPSTGCADGLDGDALVLGPPLTVTDDELEEIVSLLDRALQEVSP